MESIPRYPTVAASPSNWTFTQGFLVGQISVVIVVIVLVRYVIFEDSKTALDKESQLRVSRTSRARTRYLNSISRKSNKVTSNAASQQHQTATSASTTLQEILQKVNYDLSTHSSESMDWLNVVFAQAVAGYRDDVLAGGVGVGVGAASSSSKHNDFDEEDNEGLSGGLSEKKKRERSARALMEEILNKRTSGKKMDFLDPISVTEVDFGDQYPILTNARIRPADDTGRMRVEVDVDYSDSITMAIDTKLVINFPKPRFAVLPISLGLTVNRFSGTLAIELCSTSISSVLPTTTNPIASKSSAKSTSSTSAKKSRHELHFSLHPDFALDATATSLLGSRAKLQDVPKIEQLLIGRLRSWVHERFVWPKFWSLTLPNLVPSPGSSSGMKGDGNSGVKVNVGDDSNQMETSRGDEFNDVDRGMGNALPPYNDMRKEALRSNVGNGNASDGIPPDQIARFLASRALNGQGSLFEDQESATFNTKGSSNQNSDWNKTVRAQQRNKNSNSRPSLAARNYSKSQNRMDSSLPGSLPVNRSGDVDEDVDGGGDGQNGIAAWRNRSLNGVGNFSSDGMRHRR